jgi:hypothetical protein
VNKYLEKSDPSEALKKENYIANSVWLRLYIRNNENL